MFIYNCKKLYWKATFKVLDVMFDSVFTQMSSDCLHTRDVSSKMCRQACAIFAKLLFSTCFR